MADTDSVGGTVLVDAVADTVVAVVGVVGVVAVVAVDFAAAGASYKSLILRWVDV
jgi:hypothetical protein